MARYWPLKAHFAPNNEGVPALMRTHICAAQYSTFTRRATYDEIPVGMGLEVCASCDDCVAQCV